jgi:hypothetical protein
VEAVPAPHVTTDIGSGKRTMRRQRHGEPVEAAAADGAQEKVPLRLEGWPRSRSATLPHLSLRALEIADAIPTAAWKTLRVSHSDHWFDDESKTRVSLLHRQNQAKNQEPKNLKEGDTSNESQTGTFLKSLDT